MVSYLESKVQRKFSDLPSISNEILESLDKTIGLTFKLCGATGVMTMFLLVGKIIGPPQLNEYPVLPVAVETTIPSAQ